MARVPLVKTLLPGDVVLTFHGCLLSRAIRGVLRYFQRDGVRFSHALLVKDAFTGVEASNGLVRECDLVEEISTAVSYRVYRYVGGTMDGNADVVDHALSHLGRPYSYWRIAMQFLDQISGTRFFTRRLTTGRHVCSSLVAQAYQAVYAVRFNGVDWKSVEPDDIDDHCRRDAWNWFVVAGGK